VRVYNQAAEQEAAAASGTAAAGAASSSKGAAGVGASGYVCGARVRVTLAISSHLTIIDAYVGMGASAGWCSLVPCWMPYTHSHTVPAALSVSDITAASLSAVSQWVCSLPLYLSLLLECPSPSALLPSRCYTFHPSHSYMQPYSLPASCCCSRERQNRDRPSQPPAGSSSQSGSSSSRQPSRGCKWRRRHRGGGGGRRKRRFRRCCLCAGPCWCVAVRE
jgi:hypothetical protein